MIYMGIEIAIFVGCFCLLLSADFNQKLKFLCPKLLADFCNNATLDATASKIIKIYGLEPSGNIKGPQLVRQPQQNRL